mgnify:CR=1 FL=1
MLLEYMEHNRWKIKKINSCLSTNIEACKENNMSMVYTLHQKQGYGKSRSNWISDKGDLALSISIDSNLNMDIIIPLSLILTLKKFGYESYVKWPNDIMVGNKKAIGVLFESLYNGDKYLKTIIGIGVNILEKKELPYSINLAKLKNKELEFIYCFLDFVELFRIKSRDVLRKKINKHIYMFGKEVLYMDKNYVIYGFGEDGGLLLKEKNMDNFLEVYKSNFLNDYKK